MHSSSGAGAGPACRWNWYPATMTGTPVTNALVYEQDPVKLLAFAAALQAQGISVPALTTRAQGLQAALKDG